MRRSSRAMAAADTDPRHAGFHAAQLGRRRCTWVERPDPRRPFDRQVHDRRRNGGGRAPERGVAAGPDPRPRVSGSTIIRWRTSSRNFPTRCPALLFHDAEAGKARLTTGLAMDDPKFLQNFLVTNARSSRAAGGAGAAFPSPARISERLYRVKAKTILCGATATRWCRRSMRRVQAADQGRATMIPEAGRHWCCQSRARRWRRFSRALRTVARMQRSEIPASCCAGSAQNSLRCIRATTQLERSRLRSATQVPEQTPAHRSRVPEPEVLGGSPNRSPCGGRRRRPRAARRTDPPGPEHSPRAASTILPSRTSIENDHLQVPDWVAICTVHDPSNGAAAAAGVPMIQTGKKSQDRA